jgi:hypothetical protein
MVSFLCWSYPFSTVEDDQETANQLSNLLKPFTMRIALWKFVFQAVSEDLLGLMDTPKKSVAGSGEMLGWEAVDGSPVGGTRPVSDGGLPVLGRNGGMSGSDLLFRAGMDLNDRWICCIGLLMKWFLGLFTAMV